MYNKTVVGIVEKKAEFKDRPKLSVDGQINHMKKKGIKFNVFNEEKAKSYLENNTYYFKLKAYEKLFDKYSSPEKKNTYVNLEFAYLCDLATIDSYLRKEIINISLDIEHYLKVLLLRNFNESDEDGYEIVQDFLNTNPEYYSKQINDKMEGKACSNLVKKHSANWAIWNIVEVLSFGDFAELYRFFYKRNEQFKKSYNLSFLINPVRKLRNAAAHNNCLLQTLRIPYVSEEKFNYNYNVNAFLGRNGIKGKMLHTNMERPLVHDFCVMLYLYHCIAPKEAQKNTFEHLKGILENRFSRNKDYYSSNGVLLSTYKFVLSVVKIFLNKV